MKYAGGSFIVVLPPPLHTHPTACTGVNKAWVLRSTRAFSAGVEGAAVLVRVPAAACSPRLPRLALRPGAAPSVPRPVCTACQVPEGQRAAAEARAPE